MRKVKLTYDPKTGKRGIPKLWGNMSDISKREEHYEKHKRNSK